MQRILMLDLSQRFGGVGVRVINVATNLRPGFEAHVAVIEGSETSARMKSHGIKVWPINRSRKDPRIVHDIANCIKVLKPGVVDAHNPQSLLWGGLAARQLGVPTRVATVHSVFEESEKPGRSIFYQSLYRFMSAVSTDIVAVSENVRDHLLAQGIPSRRIQLAYNGISMPAQAIGNGAFKDGTLRVAVVGRLIPVKGHAVLFQALAKIKHAVPSFECILAGDGEERSRLAALADELGLSANIRFLGYRDDVHTVLLESNVFCMPSFTEGLPFAAIEAGSIGLPIVASAVGGLKTHFEHGISARLVPAGDIQRLADELLWCAQNWQEARQMGLLARSMIRQKFALETMMRKTEDIYATTGGNHFWNGRTAERRPIL